MAGIASDLAREIKSALAAYAAMGTVTRDPASGMTYSALQDPLNAGMIIKIPDPAFYQPPVRLEEEHGLCGLAHHYTLPEGVTPQELQAYCWVLDYAAHAGHLSPEAHAEKLRDTFDIIAGLNKPLEVLDSKTARPGQVFDMLLGVASAMQPRDIAHYVKLTAGNRFEEQLANPAHAAAYTQMALNINAMTPSWFPSLETIHDINRQFAERRTREWHERKFDMD